MATKTAKVVGALLGIGGFITTLILATRAKAAPDLSSEDVQVSDLLIVPSEVTPRSNFTISCVVKNICTIYGSYKVVLGGDFMATKSVSLDPDQSKEVSFSLSAPSTPGSYAVDVDGLHGTLVVSAVPVADIRLSNLRIDPSEAYVGETVYVTCTATNQGNAAGSRTIELVIS